MRNVVLPGQYYDQETGLHTTPHGIMLQVQGVSQNDLVTDRGQKLLWFFITSARIDDHSSCLII
jgi:hypothetical protein